jgi:adenylate kinase family enzyme
MPIVEMFRAKDKVKHIDANKSATDVYAAVVEAFAGYL